MTSTDGTPHEHLDPREEERELKHLREEIDELKAIPTEELVDPTPAPLSEAEPVPTPTDAIGSEDWDELDEDEKPAG